MNKILIVDDEENILISLEFLMRKAGYVTALARHGLEALEQIEAFRPDLVILDVMLPSIDGFEVCRQVRAREDQSNVKIIMLTAKGREVEVARGLALGANAYLTKPFSTRELLAEVQKHLS